MKIEIYEAENGWLVIQQREPMGLGATWVFQHRGPTPDDNRGTKEEAYNWAIKLLKEEPMQ